MRRNARTLADLIQLESGAEFGGVAVTDLDHGQRQDLDAWVALL